MATIRDVAKVSGVSIATVSHVLNGRTAKVSDETREKVLAAVRELRYRPTALEDRQKAIRTRNLAYMASDLSTSPIRRNQYFSLILDSVLETAALKGYSTTIFVERMWDDVGHAIRRSYDGRCDGVLLLAPTSRSEALKTLWERGTPLVSIGTAIQLQGVSFVDIDNEAASCVLTNHLLSLGHRRIAFVGGNVITASAIERARGYLKAMEEAKSDLEDVCVVLSDVAAIAGERPVSAKEAIASSIYGERVFETPGLGQDLAQHVVREAMPGVTAFVCWNDGIAREALAGLQEIGLSAPNDVSVASFDDIDDAVFQHPQLTTMRQPFHQIGKTAVELLLNRIEDDSGADQAMRFPAELVVRESTAPPKP